MKKELIILDEDKQYARERVAELQKEIQELGPEFADAFLIGSADDQGAKPVFEDVLDDDDLAGNL